MPVTFVKKMNDCMEVQVGRFLSEQIAGYDLLSEDQKMVARQLLAYLVSHADTSSSKQPLDFRIRYNIADRPSARTFSLMVNHPKPIFSILTGLVPYQGCLRYKVEDAVEATSKYYAMSGCPVVASRLSRFSALVKPMLVALDVVRLGDAHDFWLKEPSYQLYVVSYGCFSNVDLLGEHDFVSKLRALDDQGCSVRCFQLADANDYCLILRMASRAGYKLSLNVDKLVVNDYQKTFLCLVPFSASDKFEELAGGVAADLCGAVFEGSGEFTIEKNGERFELSSLLVNEIVVKTSQYFHINPQDDDEAASFYACSPSDEQSIRSIHDILESVDLVSPELLSTSFDASSRLRDTSVTSSPYATYFAVKDAGRFVVSLNTLIPDPVRLYSTDIILRMIFEHQAYGAQPQQALIKVLERPNNAAKMFDAVREMKKFLDGLSIGCRIEREEVEDLSADLVLSFALVSKSDQRASDVMQGFRKKGDVIYTVNIQSKGNRKRGEDFNDDGLFSSEIISGLLEAKLINAVVPVSRGGLFNSLFSMASLANLGFDITGDAEKSPESFLFNDSLGHVVVTVTEANEAPFIDYMIDAGVPIMLVGHVTKGELRIDDVSYGFIADLKKKVSFAFQNNIKKMASKKVVKPYEDSQSTKKEQVASMFNNIAAKYDFLNHFLSLGIDKLWRKRLVKEVGCSKPSSILDVATGTGDLAIALAKLNPKSIVGIDISDKMVEVGIEKIKARGLDSMVFLQTGDSEMINFDSNTFDFATVAFGVRNFENPVLGLREINRVLKEGGGLAVLEFAMPTKFPIRQLYKFYFFRILPFVGRFFSKDRSAYTYLPESVEAFPCGEAFLALLKEAGFSRTRIIPLTFGVANIYIGEK